VYSATLATDHDLVRRARSADQHALATIYEQYAQPIYRYAFTRVGDESAAEDIRSEVFVRMLEGLERYEERGLPLLAWLFRITHDRTMDVLRRRYRRPHVSIEYCADAISGPEQDYSEELSSEVQRFLTALCPLQRCVVQLRFFENCSIQDVAMRLGRSEGAIRALTHRGLRKLRQLMEEEGICG
jgi:RNA polymerase sigma-70 factor, ECF subfamily